MHIFHLLFKILEKPEKKKLIYIAILVFINAFVELISIGILIPLISFLLERQATIFGIDISIYFSGVESKFYLILLSLLVGLIYLIKNLFIFYYYIEQGKFVRGVQFRITSNLFKNYLYQDYNFFLKTNSGTLVRNMNVTGVVQIFLFNYLTLFLEIFLVLAMISYMLFLNLEPTLFALFFFSITLPFIYIKTRKKIFNLGKLQQEYQSVINKNYIQSFGLIKSIKIFGLEKKFSNYFDKPFFNNLYATFRLDLIQQAPKLLVEIVCVFAICFIIVFMVIFKSSTSDALLMTSIYGAVALRFMPAFSRIISSLQKLKLFLPSFNILTEEYFKTLNIREPNLIDNRLLDFSKIQLVNISYKYNDSDVDFVLENVNIDVFKNQVIGIYGESGSGKTTLVNIFSGLIFPSKGSIYIDDKLSLPSNNLIPKIGYVTQETQIFDDTIWNNITLFHEKNKNSQNSFISSIKKANLYSFVYSSTNDLKEDLLVGERGSKISGGQIQRIGIARALFFNSRILVFDEATSALDELNSKEIIETIFSLKNDRLIIIISHNKNNLINCDQVFKVKKKHVIKI
jgi:ABC-type multidrug transport system fused ATPase/permease subunit